MNGEEIRLQKKQYRKRIQDALRSLSNEEVDEQSSIVTSKALKLAAYINAQSLSIFLSMPGKEVATHDIVRQSLRDGKKVFVPYIHVSRKDPKLKIMDMLRVEDEDDLDSLRPDAWGIPSLSEDSVGSRENALGGAGCLEDSSVDVHGSSNLDLIFMPSMAFDSSMNRLGHGKGFYDRYLDLCQSLLSTELSDRRMPQLVGLALKQQMLPVGNLLPVSQQDWKVNAVVTSVD